MVTALIARVDFENNAEDFWTAFRERVEELDHTSELAEDCRVLLRWDEVELVNTISEFDSFVTSLPGWATGPEHARHPIVFTPVSD